MRLAHIAVWLAGALAPTAAAAQQQVNPPDLDCAAGFESLRSTMQWLPGAERSQDGGFELVKLSQPERWRVQIAFTMPGHPAHPTATLRTFRKQVTDVWTAESRGCGYGDRSQFAILMADMKSGDTELTNASRAEVERARKGESILAPIP